MLVQRDGSRLARFHLPRRWCQSCEIVVAAFLDVDASQLSDFSRTSTAIGTNPRYPPARPFEIRFGVIASERCGKDGSGFLVAERLGFALRDLARHGNADFRKRIALDEALTLSPSEYSLECRPPDGTYRFCLSLLVHY